MAEEDVLGGRQAWDEAKFLVDGGDAASLAGPRRPYGQGDPGETNPP